MLDGGVTKWLEYQFNVWPFTTIKFAQCQSTMFKLIKYLINSQK